MLHSAISAYIHYTTRFCVDNVLVFNKIIVTLYEVFVDVGNMYWERRFPDDKRLTTGYE